MAESRRMHAQALRSLAFGSVGAAYAAIGTPLTNQIRIIYIQNLTDATLMFSFTGPLDNVDHFVLPAGGFLLLDIMANQKEIGLYITENTQLWVKQVGVPTTGAVYLSAFYAAHTY